MQLESVLICNFCDKNSTLRKVLGKRISSPIIMENLGEECPMGANDTENLKRRLLKQEINMKKKFIQSKSSKMFCCVCVRI